MDDSTGKYLQLYAFDDFIAGGGRGVQDNRGCLCPALCLREDQHAVGGDDYGG
jgi:hypothetical protein